MSVPAFPSRVLPALVGLFLVGACGSTVAIGGSDDDVDAGDQDPPQIVVAQIADGQPFGQPVAVTAEVTDESGVSSVRLYYHSLSAAQDTNLVMEPLGGDAPDAFGAEIPGEDVASSVVYYYVMACDDVRPNNCGASPEDGDYFSFNVE